MTTPHFFAALLLTVGFGAELRAQALSIVGETTAGTRVELPKASSGKHCIIAVAASKKAEPLLLEWFEPAYMRFVAKEGLMVSDVECDLWLVPVFTGLNKAAYGPSMEQLKKEADPDITQRVVFVKDDAGALLDSWGIRERDQPYFFVIGPDGKRKHTEKGAYDVDKLDALEEALEN